MKLKKMMPKKKVIKKKPKKNKKMNMKLKLKKKPELPKLNLKLIIYIL